MTYNIEVLPQARDDLDSLAEWIAKDNLGASYRLCDRVGETVEMLARFPRWGVRRAHTGHPRMDLRSDGNGQHLQDPAR